MAPPEDANSEIRSRCTCTACICLIEWVVLFLLLIIAGVVILVVLSVPTKPQRENIILYENTTAAVNDFFSIYVKEVRLYQSPEQPEEVHNMDIFMAQRSCDDLPSSVLPSKVQSLSPPPNLTLYLLKGSELKYNICAATNESGREAAHLNFYIVNDLDVTEKAEKPDSFVYHSSLPLGHSNSLSNDTEPNEYWKCSNILYTIDKNGYYSTLLLYPSHILPNDVKVWHKTDNSYKLIDVHTLPAYCRDSETHSSGETCDITVESPDFFSPTQHHCVVVDVDNKVNVMGTSNFTHVVLKFSYYDGKKLYNIMGALFIALSTIILFILIVALIILYRYECHIKCKKIYRRLKEENHVD